VNAHQIENNILNINDQQYNKVQQHKPLIFQTLNF